MTAFYLFNLHFLLVVQPPKKSILNVHKKLSNVRDRVAHGGHVSVPHLSEAAAVAAAL